MNIECKIDPSGLNRGLALAQNFTRKTLAEAVNTAGYFVSIEARNNMPFVTAATIDTELAVISTPVIGIRGKPLKNKKNFFGKVGTSAKSAEVPLAVLIIAARARPGSNYNALTNSRYALPSWPFKGIPRAAGAWLMASLVNKMIKARHKSGSFLAAGWLPAISKLKPWARFSFAKGSVAYAGSAFFANDFLGDAQPAQQGNPIAACVIENKVGYEGVNAASFDRALQLHGAPGLQQSLDTVGEREMRYFLDKAGKEELEIPFNRAAG